MDEEKSMSQEEMSREAQKSEKPQCNHWHSEATNSCSGRCMLKEGHFTNHGCGTCHGQW